jgi:predicted Zn-dependent peptidase
MIGAEVDNENIEVTLAEIYHEFEKLKQNPVTESELQLVKNYINGNLLNLMNGPFNSIQLIRLIALYGQGMEFFEFFMAEIHMLDAKRLQDVACKYLNKEDFKEVVVGKS